MLIKDILMQKRCAVSFEFFPPKTPAGWKNLFKTITDLTSLHPAYVSVTYGAGGAARERTHDLVTELHRETDLEVAAHLTCMGHSREELAVILDRYEAAGIRNVLALRGDVPKEGPVVHGDFIHAADLVAFIRERHPEMGVGVAGFPEGHPDSVNRLVELDLLKVKMDAGADYVVTQLFFDNRDYWDYVERCRLVGITAPIVPGIMPVGSLRSLMRMAELAPCTRFPAALLRAAYEAGSEERVEEIGYRWAAGQLRELMENGAPGIHLYTLNSSSAVLRIGGLLGGFPGSP